MILKQPLNHKKETLLFMLLLEFLKVFRVIINPTKILCFTTKLLFKPFKKSFKYVFNTKLVFLSLMLFTLK